MPFRKRSYWLAVAAVAYACLGALPESKSAVVPLLGLALLPTWLAAVWRRSARLETGERRIDGAALSAMRAAHFGAALWIAARLGAAGHPGLDALANLGAGISAVSALIALARLPSEGGLLAPAASVRSIDAAAFAGLLWGIAVALPGTRALFSAGGALLDPLSIDYATTTAGVGSLLVLVAAALRLRVQRRLEMGAADRTAGALALSATAIFVAIPAAAADIAPPDRVLPVGVLAASLACVWTATTREPTAVSTALRGVLAVMILGVPTSLFAAIAVRAFPEHSALIALAGAAVAIGAGLVARDVARPLGPEQSRWLRAIETASRAALQPDPDAAIRSALEALRAASPLPDTRPELFRNAPEEVLYVDVAGYLHVEKASAPEKLYTLALAEPERTLRAEVLDAMQVRRPEVRPLLAWFEMRRAFSATIVVDEDGPLGFLLLPRGKRKRPMALEEARAICRLADRVSALLAVSSALARSRERELVATNRAAQVDTERERLEHMVRATSGRHRAYAELVARPVLVTAYSPPARFAVDELTRRGKGAEPLVLVTPPGVDPAPWAAIAHLSSAGSGGPLVIVDAATAAAHAEGLWTDPDRSPITLSDGGTLVILDAAALPRDAQEHIARVLGRRAADSSSPIPKGRLIVSLRAPVAKLLAEDRLARPFAGVLGDAPVELPPLSARAEDLRALALERLSAAGMRSRNEPLGIEPAALSLLLEHPFPGNDAELRDVLVRAAEVACGPVVTVADLEAVGFRPHAPGASAPPPTSETSSMRRRGGAPRSARGR